MNRSPRFRAWLAGVLGILMGGVLLTPAFTQQASREDLWKKVDEAVKKGLPKTAIENLDPIIEAAKKDKAWAEAVRAVGMKIALEGNIQGNKPEEKITRMHAEIEAASAEMKPVLHAILAHWYWAYFQQNRWRIVQRSQTSEPPGDDVTTWDLKRIMQEVNAQLDQALADEQLLKKTPVKEFDALLVKGTMPDVYRPTMYDFLAQIALEFFNSGEADVTQPEDLFELSASSPVFSPTADFLAWDIADKSGSRVAKALTLYQSLLKFHADDEERSAYLAADLDRLRFGYAHASGTEEKEARYIAALKRFAADHRTHVLASDAHYSWASVLRGQNKLVEAREIALQGKNLHAESVGGKQCHNLVVEIEAKQFQLTTERVWNKPWPVIAVSYKNLTRLHFRVVAANWEERLSKKKRRPEYVDDVDRKELLAATPVKSWSSDLPPTPDYQSANDEIAAPEDLKHGFYYLIASHNDKFDASDNQVQVTDFWVSDLALVTRHEYGDLKLGGLVVDALTGNAIAGATVQVWNGRNGYVKGQQSTTDANGLFQVATINQQSHIVQVTTKSGDQLVTANDYYTYTYNRQQQPSEQTIFFTDRALYRPGQTIQYKGLVIRVDQGQDSYTAVKERNLTVIFADPNGEVIAKQQHRSNEFGSFNGSFTAPRDRLMGRMNIYVENQPSGSVQFNVEEYKRPKFQVKFDAPAEAPKLGEQVTLKGTATAYTGAPIDGAKVRWRVVREVQYPYWWYWYARHSFEPGTSQEIAHGTATTGTDGTFTVTFEAKPDPKVKEDSEPVFTFKTTADVTDTNGETRSADRAVRVGYTALQATLTADDWQTAQKPVEMTIRTTSLDGEGRKAEGTIKVFGLNPPDEVHRAEILGRRPRTRLPVAARGKEQADANTDLSDPKNWPQGALVSEKKFQTDDSGNGKASFELKVGAYMAVLETQDRFGKPVTARLQVTVLDPDAEKLALKVPFLFSAPKWSLEPGEELLSVWGSGYDAARAFVEIEHRSKIVQAFWTDAKRTQIKLSHKITEELRGGFTVRVTMIRENRAYIRAQHITVPWTNKNLAIKWERFTSKLKPGAEESWTAIVTGPDSKKVVAEMVAGLYDASLDAYLPHNWMRAFGVFRNDYSSLNSNFENQAKYFNHLHGNWQNRHVSVNITWRSFPMEIVGYYYGYQWLKNARANNAMPMAAAAPAPGRGGFEMERAGFGLAKGQNMDALADSANRNGARELQQSEKRKSAGDKADGGGGPDLGNVEARTNLAETAFFFPHLVSSKEGEVRVEFKMPQALTEWKFMGFAHDAELRSGYLQDTVVTAKDLMIQPNPPRFVREGDAIQFTVKVTNQSNVQQTGTVRLTFNDARTNDSVDSALGNDERDKSFDVPPGESRSYSWTLAVPDGLGYLTYKAVGSSAKLSDGEEGFLPVLPRRILVTESLPLPIRGQQTKTFEFEHLLKSGGSKTLKHQSLTVQMVSNPSWYAVMALPYLMEYPYPCSEQVFNRLYANSLARHIANSDPKIKRIFEQWRGTSALDSPLLKNEDLKSVMIEETPWMRQANAESEARRNVGILFEENRLNEEQRRSLRQLGEMQQENGLWPWFPGGPSNQYISLYIATGFGRLRHLGVELDVTLALKSLDALDAWMDKQYRDILKAGHPEKNHLSSTIAFYLYGRSFFLKDKPIGDGHKEAVNYFLGQAKKYWLELGIRMSQGDLAIALHRFGEKEAAQGIVASLKERSVTSEELGMFWRDLELSWWWYRAPIETQALMVEVFEEVTHDAQAVEELKIWLIKQKQTQDWKTTKATADAIYALLLRGGTDVLASDALVEMIVGKTKIEPASVEAGTGFYQQKFAGVEVKPAFGEITLKKSDPGVAWGSIHWQYFEDMSKIQSYDGTPLKLTKSLYIKEHTKTGPVLKPVTGALEVGNELVVRVELRLDRDMEYVHLKDQRGSGTEPVDVLSQYKYRDGLAYYQSTRDTASHFFIDYLPKGSYVFEYSTWVVHKGAYQSGIASIECMYAPEFNSHSNSVAIEVK